ncbi:hypothetical protein, partial [uncultured Herbaspirillum sp.]|uniref:hypothetical protein n=1 Tax=uncultured Herbaspirillum sp. TaxID=160236 RepID=UPI0034517A49
MRDDAGLHQALNELGSVVAFVGPQGNRPVGLDRVDHLHRRIALGRAAGLGDATIDGQAAAILHQGMAQISQLGLLTLGFLEQPALRISLGFVGVVAPPLPSEIYFG